MVFLFFTASLSPKVYERWLEMVKEVPQLARLAKRYCCWFNDHQAPLPDGWP
jgi:hypothetical protein